MEISKDEYIVLLTSLQDRQQQAQATIMSHVVQQFTDILNRMNEPQMEAAPTEEQVAKQALELRKRMRDAFAAQAMCGMLLHADEDKVYDIANNLVTKHAEVAVAAYKVADEMLKARGE